MGEHEIQQPTFTRTNSGTSIGSIQAATGIFSARSTRNSENLLEAREFARRSDLDYIMAESPKESIVPKYRRQRRDNPFERN